MLRAITVDDEFHNLLLLKRCVEKSGQIVVTDQFTDPLSLLDRVREIHPDIIFMDIEMPVMNGFDLAEEVTRIWSDTRIVFVTAYDHYARNGVPDNAVDFLLKPIDPQDMKRVIVKLMGSTPH